jgi:hypothetical protein
MKHCSHKEVYRSENIDDTHQYFSPAEAYFKKDARGILLREIPLWIKVFLMEEEMLTMSLTEMAT